MKRWTTRERGKISLTVANNNNDHAKSKIEIECFSLDVFFTSFVFWAIWDWSQSNELVYVASNTLPWFSASFFIDDGHD